jgi:hypothetical protein
VCVSIGLLLAPAEGLGNYQEYYCQAAEYSGEGYHELQPLIVLYACYAADAHNQSSGGEQGVADGFTEAVSGNGYLAGYAYNIRERRHQRHDDISLAGGRGDEDVQRDP